MRNVRTAALGFGVLLVLILATGLLAVYGLRTLIAAEADARRETMEAVQVERLRYLVEHKLATGRAYLLTRDARLLAEVRSDRATLAAVVDSARPLLDNAEGAHFLREVVSADARNQAAFDSVVALDSLRTLPSGAERLRLADIEPARDQTDSAFTALSRQSNAQAIGAERRWIRLVVATTLGALLLGALLAITLTRTISRQTEIERRVREEVLAQSAEVERAMLELRAAHAQALSGRDSGTPR